MVSTSVVLKSEMFSCASVGERRNSRITKLTHLSEYKEYDAALITLTISCFGNSGEGKDLQLNIIKAILIKGIF
jgi:hypothetical protein